MIRLKLLKIVEDVSNGEKLAIVHLDYDNHPMGGDGEIILLETNTTLQIGNLGVIKT